MSAELDMSNGRANMAFVGEVPWHGMGTLMQPDMSIEQWAGAAGMDWSAVRVPSGYQVGNDWKTNGKWSVIRDDTFEELGTFSDRYKIVQPTQILEFFRDYILTDEAFSLETAGCLFGGKKVWALAKYNDEMSVMGEAHQPYVMLTTSFDGSLATKAQATLIRVVCKNTLQASLFAKDSATVTVRHNVTWDEKTASKAHQQLESIAAQFPAYTSLAERLAMQRMGRQQTEDFFKKLMGYEEPDPEQRTNRRTLNIIDSLMNTLELTEQEGTDTGSAWTAFNAVTRYVDHERGTRRGEGESVEQARMASSLFGTGAAMKERAMELLAA